MKNCEEMVDSLLERRDRYAVQQKRKRKVITRTAASMCCVCLVALLGFGIQRSVMPSITLPGQIAEDALYPGIKDTFDESKGESADNPAANNKIIVHQIDSFTSDRMNICLCIDDFVGMDKAKLNEYYGINVFPTVPDDIKEWEDQQYGVYKRNGGTGDVYWDGMVFNYANGDFSRTLNMEIKKDSMPLCDYAFLNATEEKSIINSVEVAIGQSADGYFYAQFLYHNVGFQLVAQGLTQDEFVAVLSSLIK